MSTRALRSAGFALRMFIAARPLLRSPSISICLLCQKLTNEKSGRVERWRGGLGWTYLLPALSFAGASLVQPCSVSTSRSSNRTCRFPASGFRTRTHAFAHGTLRSHRRSRTRPNPRCRTLSGKHVSAFPVCTLCFRHNHRRSLWQAWRVTIR